MLKVRVIPVLLLKNDGLVKGQQFKNHKYVGDPINVVKIFNDKEADEIILLDITATQQRKELNFSLLEKVTTEAFMPFAYGGGIRDLSTAKKLFTLGVEKVVLGTAALENTQLIRELADAFGSQSVVVSVDVKKKLFGSYQLLGYSGTKSFKPDLLKYIDLIQSHGVGEIMLNSVDRDGTQKGLDIELISLVSKHASVPIIACGGAWTLGHIGEAVTAGADAVAAGSMFVYEGKHKAVLITYPKYSALKALFENPVGMKIDV